MRVYQSRHDNTAAGVNKLRLRVLLKQGGVFADLDYAVSLHNNAAVFKIRSAAVSRYQSAVSKQSHIQPSRAERYDIILFLQNYIIFINSFQFLFLRRRQSLL